MCGWLRISNARVSISSWVAEAYSFDSISLIGYLAAKTSTMQIGTGIINVYSRTASAVAQTAAGCDFVTGGRFVLGLGASGPQVIEGFHGVPYEKPMARIIDYINVCRMALRREPRRVRRPDRARPTPARTGHRPRQGAQDHQPTGALGGADLLGEREGQQCRGDGADRRRLDADLLRPDEVHERLGRGPETWRRRARSAARPVADLRRWHARHRRRVRRCRSGRHARPRPIDLRVVHRWDGRPRPELLHGAWPRATATSARPRRSRTSTSTATRTRRLGSCRGKCSSTPTSSARWGRWRNGSPPTARRA